MKKKRSTTIKSCSGRCLFTLFIHLCLILQSVNGLKDYHSCEDVKKDLGDSAEDGEYIIYLASRNNVGITVYCQGMQSTDVGPQSFISLRAGRSSNFASYYENIGVKNHCTDAYPRQLYTIGGRTEFSKIGIDLNGLDVNAGDFTFTNSSGLKQIRYGSAGDKWSSSAACFPMGEFQIDLTGTPFTVTKDAIWQWSGIYASGNASGKARINFNIYLGCFIDKTDRLLPAARRDDTRNQTSENCIHFCRSKNYDYAGVEYGVECHCGNDYSKYGKTPVSDNHCNKPCSGNVQEKCGGTWFVSVYTTAISQKITGHCGGFPGYCFPATTFNFKEESLALDLMHGEHICVKNNPCMHEGRCIAIDATLFKCICHTGYTGTNCDVVNSTVIDNGQSCPDGYQAETCMCFESTCNGAKFDGDSCMSATGKAQIVCRPGDPGHVILFNKNGYGRVRCPAGSAIVGCSYWATYPAGVVHGQGLVYNQYCQVRNNSVWVQARCKQFDCGCKNGGHCNEVTGICECLPSYYGTKCETFDFCAYYEDQHNTTACKDGGICAPSYKKTIQAFGGDMNGDSCIFPFDYGDYTFNTCVEDNSMVGPPFACGGQFSDVSTNSQRSYIDLGPWNPGPRYTVAAWVKPERVNTMRQTIVGGVSACNDFGFNFNSGTFRGYLKLSSECTRDLEAGKKQAKTGQWYLVAITSNATHAMIYLNGKFMGINTLLLNHIPTTDGFWIGSAYCCSADYFRGMIKNVKVWNRALSNDEINRSMYNIGTKNSTTEALHDGLVGHWELGETVLPACAGGTAMDHGGEDWILKDGELIHGIHCNISQFVIPKGMTVLLKRYDGFTGGSVDITAQEVHIDGYLDGVGAGYRGGVTPTSSGSSGTSGESYTGKGSSSFLAQNHGGGGAGSGGRSMSDGTGRSGGGGGYGTPGMPGIKVVGDRNGLGSGGHVYGDNLISTLYMGSGGGSGGNALDMATNPKGGDGGNGGGAVRILAERSISITGVISVAGESGQGDISTGAGCMGCPDSCDLKSPVRCLGNSTVACWDKSGPGGGGSGGTVYLSAKLVNAGYKKLWAMGGDGGTGGSHCCGGAGGMGRIRIDSVIFKGIVGDTHGTLNKFPLNDLFIDYSQSGQKQIEYSTTKYGNEVYRGCFKNDPNNSTLGYKLQLSNIQLSQLTPDYCKQLCRQKNFKFSGTSNQTQCYCGNALDMTKKVADNLCNTSCSGDQLWMCGGVSSVQIFGPPPQSPAKGHNVIPKCMPWCVTADAHSNDPKWGQCGSKPSVVDWDVTCQCIPGTTGQNCDQTCQDWMYGIGCRRNCTCDRTNTATCDVRTGTCTCKPGFHGKNCESLCPSGYFGEGCANQCNCVSSVPLSVCDPMTGACLCPDGWMGPLCNFPCPKNTYGVNCTKQCSCSHGTCDPTNHGSCNCHPGYKLPFCTETCDPYTFGTNCEQLCDCNGQQCDAITGRCQCGPGYIGSKCSQPCPYGTYGQKCASRCECERGFSCQPITGECNCGPGFVGENCQRNCTDGQFGVDCMYPCSCIQNNSESCDNMYGKCTCKPGYKGASCELTCDPGYYGNMCEHLCTCKNGGTCDHSSGKCTCAPGFRGENCENTCPKGYYGNNCSSRCISTCSGGSCNVVLGICCNSSSCPTCPKNTAGLTSGCDKFCNCVNGRCLNSGACICQPGWKGAQCDTPCDAGTYGSSCSMTCNCKHGDCNTATGICDCYDGYTDDDCSKPCQGDTFGPNCTFHCPDCGPYSYPSCNKSTGACKCSAGYTGPLCDKMCPAGKWGISCSKICSCQHGICDPVSGTCNCDAGYKGDHCEIQCKSGHWGSNCQYSCDCSPHSDGCTPDYGICRCKPGFAGVKCQESCAVGYYGQNCTQKCRCDQMSSTCSPIDGTCLCFSGYAGEGCGSVCSPGHWGRGCTQNCECNGKGGCNPFNGQCDCAPGYKGKQCDQQCDQDINWGKDCTFLCSCNGAHCDHRDGTCRCPPGKFGHNCEKGCNEGYFGFQCAQACGCKNDAQCDSVTGSCQCQPGWSGQFCDESCPANYYGVDCGELCPNCVNGDCSPFDGSCHCESGYTGVSCNITLLTANQPYIDSQNPVSLSGINFTIGQLVGLIVGFVLLLVTVTVLAVFVTRRFSVGRFAGTQGAMKFGGEDGREFDVPKHSNVGTSRADIPTGFVNPVHEASFDETDLDQRSIVSEATSGVASAMVDSGDDDDDDDTYFTDSKA